MSAWILRVTSYTFDFDGEIEVFMVSHISDKSMMYMRRGHVIVLIYQTERVDTHFILADIYDLRDYSTTIPLLLA